MPPGHRFSFDKRHKLDDPERKRFQPVEPLIELVRGTRSRNILDMGAGTGYFAIPLARELESARVLALDVEPRMLQELSQRATQAGLSDRIDTMTGDVCTLPIENNKVDLALMVNLYHELDDRPATLKEVARVLEPSGILLVVDWDPEATGEVGPPKDHRIPRNTVQTELEQAGFEEIKTHDLYQDIFVFSACVR